MAANAFVRIHEHKVQEFLEPGGEVNDLVHDISKLTKYFARGHIHNRTGTLGRMIQVNRPSRSGAFEIRGLVFTRTSYALYVHEGTGTIYAKNGRYLAVPRRRQGNPNLSGGTLRRMWKASQARKTHKMSGGKPYFTTTHISGQRANPFLQKGLHEAMGTLR
ncbi:hypothetical protein SEA_BRUHMOMENT_28 [Arthrobacter phage BruhMoment]|nr:hypothetical protein SEA_BRUHMOMENT_28 [Arthrobacter phage BruhMoment]